MGDKIHIRALKPPQVRLGASPSYHVLGGLSQRTKVPDLPSPWGDAPIRSAPHSRPGCGVKNGNYYTEHYHRPSQSTSLVESCPKLASDHKNSNQIAKKKLYPYLGVEMDLHWGVLKID